MSEIIRRRFRSHSDNPKSAIENLKWVGTFAIVLTLVFGGAVTHAQQPGKIFRIGFLDPTNASDNAVRLEVFRQELRKLGWIEGKKYRFRVQVCRAKT